MTYHFYKTVRYYHITGAMPITPTTGIIHGGLDPALRNAFGGCTVGARVSSARSDSASDHTGVGQCLTGDRPGLRNG